MKKKENIRLSACIFSVISLFGIEAQGQNNVTEQVEVKREYKPVLNESLKIRKSPNFEDPEKPVSQNYGFKELYLKADTGVNSIRPEEITRVDSNKIFPLYFQIGGGSATTLFGNLYFNSRPSPTLNYGINIRHLSLSGKLENQRFSTDQINFLGKKILDHNYISGDLGLNLNSNPFYGYDHFLDHFSSAQVKQQFRKFTAGLEFGKAIDTSGGIQYHARIGGYYLGDSYSESENHVDILGGLGFSYNRFNFQIGTIYQNNIFTTPIQNFNTSLLKIDPSLTIKTDLLALKLGLKIEYELGDRNQTYLFPDISLDVILSQGFNVYGGISGDIIQNSFKNLTDKNPYLLGISGNSLNVGFTLINTKQSILFYGGIKGAFSTSFNYRAQIDIGQNDRLPFFKNSFNTIDNFTLVYDGNRTVYTKVFGEFNYIFSDQFRLNTNLTIQSYKLTTLLKPWYTPNYRLEVVAHYNPTQNWAITGSLLGIGTQYADASYPNIMTLAPTVPAIAEIKPYLDMNLGIEYKASKKVGVFVQANNLLNKEYERFLNYPVIGLNILGGLWVRF